MASLFGGSSRKDVFNATPFGQLPNFQKGFFEDALRRGTHIGITRPDLFSPVGFTVPQQQALDRLQQGVEAPRLGSFDFGKRASSEFNRAGDFLGQSEQALSRFDPTLTSALSSLQAGQAPITSEQLQSGFSDFINPFTQQVIDPAIQDIEDVASRRRSELSGRVSGNLGAFGGARTGIESALLQRDAARESGRLSGQLRSDAFKTASQQALDRLTGERTRSLTGGQLGLGALDRILGQGNQFAQLAGQARGLGGQLFGAREGIERLRGNVRDRQVQGLQEQIGAGDIFRQLAQQQQDSPLRQIEFLRSLATTGTGTAGGTLPSRPGILGGIAGAASGLSKLASGTGSALKQIQRLI